MKQETSMVGNQNKTERVLLSIEVYVPILCKNLTANCKIQIQHILGRDPWCYLKCWQPIFWKVKHGNMPNESSFSVRWYTGALGRYNGRYCDSVFLPTLVPTLLSSPRLPGARSLVLAFNAVLWHHPWQLVCDQLVPRDKKQDVRTQMSSSAGGQS